MIRPRRSDPYRREALAAAIRLMNGAFNSVRLYPPTHSEVAGVLGKLYAAVGALLERGEEVGFGFMDQLLYLDGAASTEETAANPVLVERLAKARVQYVVMRRGMSAPDLLAFFQLLNAEAARPTDERPGELLERRGVTSIHLVEAEPEDQRERDTIGRRKPLLDAYLRAIGVLGEFQEALRSGAGPDVKPVRRLADELVVSVRSRGHEPYLLLPFAEHGHDLHLAHAVNVAVLCCAMGELHGLGSARSAELCLAALLHDMGRMIIPAEWTRAREEMPPEVADAAARHGEWGFLLLAREEGVPLQAALAAAGHHSPSTGSVEERILALADEYDLATPGGRLYWNPRRKDRYLARLVNSRGARHEPTLVKLLLQTVGGYPAGSVVRLADGRRGVVVRPNPDFILRPRLWLLDEESPEPTVIDCAQLDADGLGFLHEIDRVVSPPPDLAERLLLQKDHLLSQSL